MDPSVAWSWSWSSLSLLSLLAASSLLLLLRTYPPSLYPSSSSPSSPSKQPATPAQQQKEKEKKGSSVLDLMSQTERLRLQSRVANAKSAEDLYLIFDDFALLHHLDLQIERERERDQGSADQAFRDLVRDKVNINNESVLVPEEHTHSPVAYRSYFHSLVLHVVRELSASSLALVQKSLPQNEGREKQRTEHMPSLSAVKSASRGLDPEQLATHLCCHLARTRAGGDTFFCLSDIFNSPQLVITVSHTDTHPPTDLDTSADGWAFITTTSNFDVYLAKDLHADPDVDTSVDSNSVGGGSSECSPLVTLSARLEEAIPMSAAAQLERDSLEGRVSVSSSPAPYYRTMSVVCFDPCDPSRFRGGGGGKTVGASIRRCSPISGGVSTCSSDYASSNTNHPNNNVFRRKGFLRKSGLDCRRPVDTVDIPTSTPPPKADTDVLMGNE